MTRWLTLLPVLVLVVSATASADWARNTDSTKNDCSSLEPGNRCFYDFATTTDPSPLDASQCTNGVTYLFDPDEDGTNTGAEVQPYRCSESTFSANHCAAIYNDTDGDGIPNALTLDGVTNLRIGAENVFIPVYIAFDVTANPSSDDARITIGCF